MFDPSSIERRLGRYNADVYDWAQNTLTTAVIATIMVAVTVKAAAQAADDLNALNEQVSRLYQQGKIDQAYLIARRYVASARAQFGDEHQEYAAAIASLATVYRKQGKAIIQKLNRCTNVVSQFLKKCLVPIINMLAMRLTNWASCTGIKAVMPKQNCFINGV
jgi:hypothetical protein